MGHTLKKYCHGAWIVKKARFISLKYRALHKAIGWQMLSKEQKELCQPERIGNSVHLFIYSFLRSSNSTEHLWQSIYWPARPCGCSVNPDIIRGEPTEKPVVRQESSCRRAFFFYSNFSFFEGTSHYYTNTWSLLPERPHMNSCILLPPFSAQSTLWLWRLKQLTLSLNSYHLTSGWTIFGFVLLGSFIEI